LSDKTCSADGYCECLDGGKQFIDGECIRICYDYTFSLNDLSWSDAKQKCENLGGTLASAREFEITNLQKMNIDQFSRWVINTISSLLNELHYLFNLLLRSVYKIKINHKLGNGSAVNISNRMIPIGNFICILLFLEFE
jgi:hypothetical protein